MKTSYLKIAAILALGLAFATAHAFGVDPMAFISPEAAMGLTMAGAALSTNYVQEGDTLDLAPTANVLPGVGHLFGVSLFGVSLNSATAGVTNSFATKGVFEMAKTSALAIAVGDRVYWDAANKVVNKTTTAQQCIGIAVSAAGNPSATVKVKLGAVPAVAA